MVHGWCFPNDISVSVTSLLMPVNTVLFTYLLLPLSDIMTVVIYIAASSLLLVIEKKCKSLLDISKFRGYPSFDFVMKYVVRKPEE